MRIMTVSDSPSIFSGLARVHRHAIEGLMEAGHEVMPLGWFAYTSEQLESIRKGQKVPPVQMKLAGKDTKILCVPKKNGMNSMYAVYDAMDYFKPDVILTIGDHWDFWYMQAIKVKTAFALKWVAYLTIEHDEISPKWEPLFRYADAVVVPSKFGKAVVEGVTGNQAVVVPYGTEENFRRASPGDRRRLRRERGCEKKVRFITVAQNTQRKNLPALLQAVKLIAHRDPGRTMEFYVHTNVDALDPQEAYLWDLKRAARKLGVEDWFSFPDGEDPVTVFGAPADRLLTDEYNASDFFVSPSTCEGYGLPLCEAMACGLPAIANATSTSPEHLGASADQRYGLADRGFLVSNREEIWPPCRIVRPVRVDALGQAIWEMACLCREELRSAELEAMRAACEEYGKGRTWAAMKNSLADVMARVAGPATIPVEEL